MNPKFKVLLYEPIHPEGTKLLEEKCDPVYAESFEEENLIRQARDVDAIILRFKGLVTRALMESAAHLKVVGRHGVGLDNVDLMAAKDHGIEVVYTPTANTQSVAEHFVALALVLAKKVRLADMALRAGRWEARFARWPRQFAPNLRSAPRCLAARLRRKRRRCPGRSCSS